MALAHELGISIPELWAMPYKDLQLWQAFFVRRAEEVRDLGGDR